MVENILEKMPEERLSYARHGMGNLTQREQQVMRFVANAYSLKQTASELGLSPRTIEIYRSRVFSKLGARGSIDLVRIIANLTSG